MLLLAGPTAGALLLMHVATAACDGRAAARTAASELLAYILLHCRCLAAGVLLLMCVASAACDG